nr:hypothetical protein [Tessaracoccus sp.]
MQLIKAWYGDPDRSLILQFIDYSKQLLQGDLGRSARVLPDPGH